MLLSCLEVHQLKFVVVLHDSAGNDMASDRGMDECYGAGVVNDSYQGLHTFAH